MSTSNSSDARFNLEKRFNDGDFDTVYAEFIKVFAPGDCVICNGATLLEAMEARYLADEFLNYLENLE